MIQIRSGRQRRVRDHRSRPGRARGLRIRADSGPCRMRMILWRCP